MDPAPDPSLLEGKVESMNADLARVQSTWTDSAYRADLLQVLSFLIDDVFPTRKEVTFDSALCLGLGSFEHVIPVDAETLKHAGPRGEFYAGNHSFHQLLFMETVVDMLRKTFDIGTIAFQDPAFTAADTAFIEQRGHTVVPYPASEKTKADHRDGPGLDPFIRQQFSSATFLFAPCVMLPVLAAAVHALRPHLYLGTDFIAFEDSSKLNAPGTPSDPLMDDLRAMTWCYDFEEMPVLGSGMGFHWRANETDDDDELRDRAYARLILRMEIEVGSVRWRQKWRLEKDMRKLGSEEALRLMESKVKRLRLDEQFTTYWRTRLEKGGEKEGSGKKV